MTIQNTGGSGIAGTGVTNFSFVNGTIDGSGNAGFESNIAFNTTPTTADNISGTLTVTGSNLTDAYYSGIDIQAGAGTLSTANLSNNTIASSTLIAESKGFGININGVGTASTALNLTRATIQNNAITGFPSAGGIQIQLSNANATGPGADGGALGSAADRIDILTNTIHGFSGANPMGTSAIAFVGTGANGASRTVMNGRIHDNDIEDVAGTAILIGNNGYADMDLSVMTNTIVANHVANDLAGNGIGGGNGGAVVAASPSLDLIVSNNTISQTDGNGILLVGRATNGVATFTVQNNTVAAPINVGGSLRQGIRVDAGNGIGGSNDTVCLTVTDNTSAGSNGAAGIGLRKEGSVLGVHTFGINGLTPSPANGAQLELYVEGQNPAAVDAINGDNFVSC